MSSPLSESQIVKANPPPTPKKQRKDVGICAYMIKRRGATEKTECGARCYNDFCHKHTPKALSAHNEAYHRKKSMLAAESLEAAINEFENPKKEEVVAVAVVTQEKK